MTHARNWRAELLLFMDPHNDRLPVDLVAQMVEHCIGIAELRVRVPFRPEFSLLKKYWKTTNITNIKERTAQSQLSFFGLRKKKFKQFTRVVSKFYSFCNSVRKIKSRTNIFPHFQLPVMQPIKTTDTNTACHLFSHKFDTISVLIFQRVLAILQPFFTSNLQGWVNILLIS